MRWQQRVLFHRQGPKLEFLKGLFIQLSGLSPHSPSSGLEAVRCLQEGTSGWRYLLVTVYTCSPAQPKPKPGVLSRESNRRTTHHLLCCRILDDKPLHLALSLSSPLSLSGNHSPPRINTTRVIQTSCSFKSISSLVPAEPSRRSLSSLPPPQLRTSHGLSARCVPAPDSNFVARYPLAVSQIEEREFPQLLHFFSS
jgi:hypothetical protein